MFLYQTKADIMEYTADGAQPPSAEERSAGELVKLLSDQVSVLVRDELKLAQLEMTRRGKQAGVGIGMLGGSALAALYAVGCPARVRDHRHRRGGGSVAARDQFAGNAEAARQKAMAVGGTGKKRLQAQFTPVWEAAPEPVRRAVAKGASTATQRRVQLAVAAVALLVGYLAFRQWRRQ